MVPVSSGTYGTSRPGAAMIGACALAGWWIGGGLVGSGAAAPPPCNGLVGVAGAPGAPCAPCAGVGVGAVGCGAGWFRWRTASIFALIVASCLLTASLTCVTCLQPRVAVANSAHIHSVLRRMSSLHREKDAGAVLAAQHPGVAPLGVRHDAHHVAAGAAHAGDVARGAVRVFAPVTPHDLAVRRELVGNVGIVYGVAR